MKKLLTLLSCVFLLALLGCPAIPPPSSRTLGVTLNTYEVKAGDTITIDSQGVPVFLMQCKALYYDKSAENAFKLEIYVGTENLGGVPSIIYHGTDGTSNGLRKEIELVEKISYTKASFRVPDDMITGTLSLSFNEWLDEDANISYSYAISDKPVTVIE